MAMAGPLLNGLPIRGPASPRVAPVSADILGNLGLHPAGKTYAAYAELSAALITYGRPEATGQLAEMNIVLMLL
jgi:hypothetical protein